MAEMLRAEVLASKLDCPELRENIIIIDCRPFMAVNTGVINGANQVHCPPIVKRRSGGNIPLDNILRSQEAREKLVQGNYSHIVVYDENTACLENLAKDSNMFLVIKTLSEEKSAHRLHYLHGGFQTFHSSFPHLCSLDTMATDSVASPMVMCLSLGHQGNHLQPLNQSNIILREPNRAKRLSFSCDKEPSEVLPWLFIGNLQHALHADHLQQLGMSALINMAASTESSPIPSPHFIYKNIPVRDSVTADIMQWFPDVICFIEKVRRTQGKVLVHCQAGISRSATICIAYLMYHKDICLEDAFDFLKNKRAVISPNLNFMRQLVEFETQLRQNTPTNIGDRSPTMALGLIRDKVTTKKKSSLTLPGVASCMQQSPFVCMQQSPFAFDMPYTSPAPSSPIVPLPSPLMSPS